MKTKISFIAVMLLAIVGNSKVSANWVYTGSAPWIWDHANGWSYVPGQSDLVWAADSQSWILSPYGNPVDLRGIDSTGPLRIELSNGEDLWTVVLYPGSTNGQLDQPFLLFDDQVFDLYAIDYSMMVDEGNGTILLYVGCDTKGVTANFSLLLNFSDLENGSYQLVGNLPASASSATESVELKGAFTLK